MELSGNRRSAYLSRSTPLTMGNVHGLGFIVVLAVTNFQNYTLLSYAGAGRGGAEPFGDAEPCVVDDEGRLHSWAGEMSSRLTSHGGSVGIAAFHYPIGSGVKELYLSTVTPEKDDPWDDAVHVDPRGVMVPLT